MEKSVYIIGKNEDLFDFLSTPNPKVVIFHGNNFVFNPIEGLKLKTDELAWNFVIKSSNVHMGSYLFNINDEKNNNYLNSKFPGFDNYKNKMVFLALFSDGKVFFKDLECHYDILSQVILETVTKEEVVKNDTIYYVGASFCLPCRRIMLKINDLKNEFTNLSFKKIDFDFSPYLVNLYDIEKIPTFCLVRAGNSVPIFKYQNSDYNLVRERIIDWTSTHVVNISDDF